MSHFLFVSFGSNTHRSRVRGGFAAALLLLVMSFGLKTARAQPPPPALGWPEWLHVGGNLYGAITAIYFFDPTHGIAAGPGLATYHDGARSVFYTVPGGQWWPANIPPGVGAMTAIRSIQGKLYAVTKGSDVLVSTDSGRSWNFTGLGVANDVYADGTGKIRTLTGPMVTFARMDTLHCVATGSGNIYTSTDGGLNWTSFSPGTDPGSAGAYADRCQHTYVVPNSWGTALRSTDSGVTWQTVATGSGPFIEILAGASTVQYISNQGGMYRSTDDGLTWTSLITVNGGQHIMDVWGPMGEHVAVDWPDAGGEPGVWMTSTGGDDMLHSGVNMTDSNGAPLLQQDTFNVPLRLTSRCNAYSIPIPFYSDVDGMSEKVSIAKDDHGDFALIGPTSIDLPKGHDRFLTLAYNPKHPVSTLLLRFDNHWHCSDWTEYRSVIVNAMPEGQIVPPKPISGACTPVRQAAFLQIDSCQTLSIDSVYIPRRISSRLRFDAKLPDIVRAGYKDSLYFTFDPTDTLCTIYDSVQVFAHFLGIDSTYNLWDFGIPSGEDTDFAYFQKTVPVTLLAVSQVALIASDTIVSLHRAALCERSLDTFVRFTNKSCTQDTIVDAQLSGTGYFMSGVPLPIILKPDSGATFALHFRAPDTGVFPGNLKVTVTAGQSQTLSIPLSSIGFPTRGILNLTSTTMNAGSFSFCAGDTTLATAIYNTGCDTLAISNIRFTGDTTFTLTTSKSDTLLVPNDSLPFAFRFAPRTKGAHHMDVTFHSKNLYGNDAGHDTTITLDGVGLSGTKILTASTSTIDAGKTYICEERDTFVVIQNTGCDTLCVSSLTLTPTGFVLASGTPTTFCLNPNEIDTVRLRTVIDTANQQPTNTATINIMSNADQPLPPITLTREIEYPSKWNLVMEAASDSARAGQEVTYRVIQHGLLPQDVTAVSGRLTFDSDLLQFLRVDEPNVTMISGGITNPGDKNVFLVTPLTTDSVLATFHFKCFVAPHLTTMITLDSVVVTSTDSRSQECIASILSPASGWTAASAFSLIQECGTDLLGYPLRGETLHFDGVSPNPASTEIVLGYTLDALAPVGGDISIEDALGREVLRETVTLQPGAAQKHVVSLKGLPSGVYLVRVSDGAFGKTWRVIKE